jgi:hypothetical protein
MAMPNEPEIGLAHQSSGSECHAGWLSGQLPVRNDSQLPVDEPPEGLFS